MDELKKTDASRSDSEELGTLKRFLSFRPESADPILMMFAELEGAVAHLDGGKYNFVYVPGSRPDRVLLIAHADTVWDLYYLEEKAPYLGRSFLKKLPKRKHDPVLKDGVFTQNGWNSWGMGADDRAGCAMLWLLRDSGHSLLVTDGEEHGQIASHYLMTRYPELAKELNDHRYMIQLDRRGGSDYKTYALPVTEEFRRFIEEHTGYRDAGSLSRTDIVALCTGICGVNLSIGYHDEHTAEETLDYSQWLGTLQKVRKLLAQEQPRFPLADA